MKNVLKIFLDKYMKNPAENMDVSDFPADEICRYGIVFSGIVQDVGFRYETWTLAQKLQLVGFVENLGNGDVYAEIQGPKNKILYLIECLKSIPRIQIENVKMTEMKIKKDTSFEIAN